MVLDIMQRPKATPELERYPMTASLAEATRRNSAARKCYASLPGDAQDRSPMRSWNDSAPELSLRRCVRPHYMA
jgi:hypothetical protein